jgi:nucleoid-associated protein YgaU
MSSPRGAASRALQLIAAPALAAALLWQMRGALPLPGGFSLPDTERWLLDQGPLVAAFALLRGVALLAAVYTTVIGAIGLLAVVARSSTLATITVRLTLPSLRPLIAPVAALTLTIGGALPAGAAAFADRPPPDPAMRVSREVPPDAREAPVMQLLPAAPEPSPPLVALEESYTVSAGDSFWSIAAQRVRIATGLAPSDAEVARYWRVLIEANRDHLVVPGEPDLIHPGQIFTLPPLS